MRVEKDLLGEKSIAEDCYYGIHTLRAVENFSISGKRVHKNLIRAIALIKESAAQVNMDLGYLEKEKAIAIIAASKEMAAGDLEQYIIVDALQGGAGTSTNMNINEVIANRALELAGRNKGSYDYIHPIEHVNLHQSTNDVYPSGLKIACLWTLEELSKACENLQDSLQKKEQEFAQMIKMGRTQLQDAVPITLGQEFSAYAQAIARDRWRIYKCQERLKQINLGGTAIGTGITAPLKYVFAVVEKLRSLAKVNIGRSENMIDATQNVDAFVEISGLVKTLAVNLNKIANDLRLLSSGPSAGFRDIELPSCQAGSSIMPGKVNPVIAEATNQACFHVMAGDLAISLGAQNGQLELNAFLPLIAHHILENIELMTKTVTMLDKRCIQGILPNEERMRYVVYHSPALITALVPYVGYRKATELAVEMSKTGVSIETILKKYNLMNTQQIEEFLDPYQLTKPYKDKKRES
ncbi:aspartate ammonia-lyase [Anaerosinus massiliensis]|uniref:aspartate ammonia-lyase n=1 Tax=Massilibacillus massiliensis TaxID=1806837 RepID=UPI000B0BAC44|nr:aspartate ammonia-lyase [Massilibacillus massiliensis]